MKITIYSKEGCQYCEHAVTLCESEGIDYEKVMIEKEELKKLCDGRLDSYPQIFADGRRIGNYFEFQDSLVHPQTEDYNGNVSPVGPRGVYDEAKRFMESITMAYHRFHGLETRIVRIFNTYGPRMRLNDGRVVPAFMGQVLRGEDLTVFGDGSQTRSFCYISDQVAGIYSLLMSDYAEPVNIGNPHETTILEFAQEIQRLSGTDQKIVFKPLPQDDPLQRKPDISLAKKVLDWTPKVSREEGIAKVFDYFKSLPLEELNAKAHRDFK